MASKIKAFNGQWVDIFTTGTHTDNKGRKHVIDDKFLEQVVANFDSNLHEPPAVIGHPQTNNPAFGWVCAQRVHEGRLQVQFCDVDSAFAEMVRDGKFKKRSASFYLDADAAPGGRAPSLQHVGFLGAKPPAVKGLRDIQFNEGDAITFETINFSEGESMDEKDVQSLGDRIVEGLKNALGIGKTEKEQPAFSEAALDERIKKAVDAATAEFTEKVTKLETENKDLRTATESNSGATRKAEIASFCERLGTSRFPPAFRNMGAVEFMESLAALEGDPKVTFISFEEKEGEKKEVKTETSPLKWFQNFLEGIAPVIQFGEHFGSLHTSGDGAEIVDPKEMDKVRTGMGTTKREGGAK